MDIAAFKPASATATVNLAVTTSSDRVQVQSAPTSRHVRLYNAGDATAFVAFGGAAVVAAVATGVPLPSGAIEIFSAPHTHVAAITASGTATLYATPGEGT